MIDSHMHVHYAGFSPEKLIQYMDDEQVSKVWLLTWEEQNVPWKRIHLTLDQVLETARKNPDKVIPFYAPDPRRPDAVEAYLRAVASGVRGCGELKTSLRWDAPELAPLLGKLNELGSVLVFHMEEPRQMEMANPGLLCGFLAKIYLTRNPILKYLRIPLEYLTKKTEYFKRLRARSLFDFPGYLMDFKGLELMLTRYPDIHFVGHGPLFWKGISGILGDEPYPSTPIQPGGIVPDLLSRYKNLFADLSGGSGYNALTRDPAYMRSFLERFKHKLLFGSDNTGPKIRNIIEKYELSAEARDKIFFGNAEGLLKDPSGRANKNQ